MTVRRVFQFGACLIAVLTGTSCSNAGKSGQVSINVNPQQPFVITGSFTNSNGQSVQAPWFQFTGTVTNKSNEPLTLVALQLMITAMKSDGTFVTKTATSLPQDSNFMLECTGTGAAGATTVNLQFYSFGTFPPDGLPHPFTLMNNALIPTGCSQAPGSNVDAYGDVSSPTLYVGGNPDQTNDGVANFNYTVQMQPLGWFGTYTAPTERFEKYIYFTTQ